MYDMLRALGSGNWPGTGEADAPVTRRRGLDALDVLVVIYVFSFYALMASPELSWVSFLLAGSILSVLSYRHFFVDPLQFPKFFWVPWLFVLFNILSMFWSRDVAEALDANMMLISAVFGAAGIWIALKNGTTARTVIYAMSVGAVILIIGAAIQGISASGRERVAGLVGNANTMAMYLSYPFMLFWCTDDRRVSRLKVVGIGFVIFAFMFTGSRKVIFDLILLVALLLIYMATHLSTKTFWRSLGMVVLGLMLAIWVVGWNDLADRVSQFFEANQVLMRTENLELEREGSSAYQRKNMMIVALSLWADEPFIGQGAGQYATRSGFGMYAHANYAELLANGGIIGLLLYYFLPLVLIARLIRGRKWFSSSPGLWGSLLTVLLAVLAIDIAAVTYTLKASWVFLVCLMAIIEEKEKMAASADQEPVRDVSAGVA